MNFLTLLKEHNNEKNIIISIIVISSQIVIADVYVKGHTRKDGTYVRAHHRTSPNHTVTDNYSYPGNYNLNTGKITGGSVERNNRYSDLNYSGYQTRYYGFSTIAVKKIVEIKAEAKVKDLECAVAKAKAEADLKQRLLEKKEKKETEIKAKFEKEEAEKAAEEAENRAKQLEKLRQSLIYTKTMAEDKEILEKANIRFKEIMNKIKTGK